MAAHTSIAAIILAAGSSSRMEHGHHKLLLPLGDRPVIAHIVQATLASQARPAVVVLGHQAQNIQTTITTYHNDASLHFVENAAYRQGMSTSLHRGITILQQLDSAASITGAIVLLGDQPFINATIIDTLIAAKARSGKLIIASSYQGKRGNPVLFDASLFPELLTTSGDEGGRSVIANHKQDIELVEISAAMAIHDVDTWEAYQQALAAWQQN